MRVLHLTTEFPPLIYGGLGTAIGGLVGASSAAQIAARVLLVNGGGASYPGTVHDLPGTVQGAGPIASEGSGPASGTAIVVQASHDDAEATALALMAAWHPDLLHLHVFWLWPLAQRLRTITGIPLVYTVHSLDIAEYDLGQGPAECLPQWELQRDLISQADLVIAISESERRLIGAYCPRATSHVRVVGNGIADMEQARHAAYRPREHPEPLVLFSGRFVERKGVQDLLAAIPMVLEAAPAARFVLAGGHRGASGDDMAGYWLPSTCHPYRNQITFTGWLAPEALANWYAAADILVIPSWYEPFGMVVLEGMLFGLAVAAAAVGGPAEIISDENDGLLFPPHDPKTLGTTLIRLAGDRPLRARLGRAAADEVRHRWLYASVVQRMKAAYEEVRPTTRSESTT
jgi:glycogen synthase